MRIERGGARWPSELADVESEPDALWLRGRLELLERRPRVALVGTRAPTPYGEAQAGRFARLFARAGLTVVSGLARGIDQVAHSACLDAGGATLAVLGSGIDKPWPAGALSERVAREGLLLSEFQPGEAPLPHHFPLRNRIISALSCAVVVIEAAHASGSLITARWAADQGRPVFALPGRVDHPMSRGVHKLLREGAELTEGPEDVLAALGFAAPASASDPAPARSDARWAPLRKALRGESLGSAELAQRLARPLTEILVEIVEAEMAGLVRRLPGGRYHWCEPGE